MQPEKIGRYRVLSQLGHGAMGVVYSARDDQMGRDVAVKMMTNQLEADPEARARFFREAQLTGKLLHRNVVTVLDLGEEEGRPFLVMELLKGTTLNKALRDRRPCSLELKLEWMIQTCDGLARAHAAGVIHRDVKPTNLFVLTDGSLKILDFGVARLADSSMTRSGLVIGTPDYMSPEQARGEEVTARSDLFSAAAVFYFMITGRRPFEAGDMPSILRKVVNEDAPPIAPGEAPPQLARVILRALRKNPESRYQSAVEMAADLIRVRRHLDHELRQLGTAVQNQYGHVVRLADGLAFLRGKLDRPPVSTAHDAIAGLRTRFSFLGATAPESGPQPFGRDQLTAIAEQLRQARESMLAQLEALALSAAIPQPVRDEPPLPPTIVRLNPSERDPIDPVIRLDVPPGGGHGQEPSLTLRRPGLGGLVRKTAGTLSRWFPRRRSGPDS